ncbi:type IX secretion system membrane protein PorP/SprF [Tamlana sp. 2201CG12-4]|uniref:PorP/SprF family type IX secretion system membrane protein n=1 Tax=Tamlana sp. 2201CG12-4 TaxID=3112582 RepID=UPI002DBD97C8|nr:type IX secretion system membrane protein PorP/SprF [Tamlana sp. 2201CG12-4]MEC3906464.1 type IX secretion system membrane protein PorP/SprF [Tamlana sp. 2201CG12-4]
MKKNISLRLALFCWMCLGMHVLTAQQNPLYTQYMYAPTIINAANVAAVENPEATLIARTQWVGIEGAPTTLSFDFSTPLTQRLGGGITVVYDELGAVKESTLNVNLGYKFNISDKGKLAFGIKGGISQLDVNSLIFSDDNQDPLFGDVISKVSPNFGLGLFYYTDNFYLGLAAPNILNTEHLDTSDGIASTTAADVIHYYGTAGLVLRVSREMKLKPSVQYQFGEESNSSIDISLNMLVNNQFEFGLSHRRDNFENPESISFIAAFNLAKIFRVGFAYEYSLNGYRNFSSGTYEAILKAGFNSTSSPSPRFF